MSTDIKLSTADKSLLRPLLEEKLRRVKAVKPHEDNKLATEMYKRELVRVLKKLNPKGLYYAY